MQWQNSYDSPLKVQCSNKEGFYLVKSQHSNGAEDRQWEWHCRRVATKNFDKTPWTGYINSFDEPIFFNCQKNHFLCGVESYHSNHAEDRRWKFKCCHSPNHFTRNCHLSGYVNSWDGWMNYQVGNNEVITGVYSYHRNDKELVVTLYAKYMMI